MKNLRQVVPTAFVVIISSMLTSCVQVQTVDEALKLDEGLTESQGNFLDSQEAVTYIDPALLYFGDQDAPPAADVHTPESEKQKAISAMIAKANFLMDRSLHQHDADTSGPAQNGLAYVLGAKQIDTRSTPTGGACCTEKLYGLDCSGMLALCANSSGAKLIVGPARLQGQADTWNAVGTIPDVWSVGMVDVTNELSQSNFAINRFQTGDIVNWGFHIGFVAVSYKNNTTPLLDTKVLQSNGSPGCTGLNSESIEQCREVKGKGNRSISRGPRAMSLANMINSSDFGKPVSVLRMMPKFEMWFLYTFWMSGSQQDDVFARIVPNNPANPNKVIEGQKLKIEVTYVGKFPQSFYSTTTPIPIVAMYKGNNFGDTTTRLGDFSRQAEAGTHTYAFDFTVPKTGKAVISKTPEHVPGTKSSTGFKVTIVPDSSK